MKKIMTIAVAVLLLSACTVTVKRPVYRHDNGKHKGWVKSHHKAKPQEKVVKGKKKYIVEEKKNNNHKK